MVMRLESTALLMFIDCKVYSVIHFLYHPISPDLLSFIIMKQKECEKIYI